MSNVNEWGRRSWPVLGFLCLVLFMGCADEGKDKEGVEEMDIEWIIDQVSANPEKYYEKTLEKLSSPEAMSDSAYDSFLGLKELLEYELVTPERGVIQEEYGLFQKEEPAGFRRSLRKFFLWIRKGFVFDERTDFCPKRDVNLKEKAGYTVIGYHKSVSLAKKGPVRGRIRKKYGLCSNEKFGQQFAVKGKTFSGILLETQAGAPQRELYVLTAGHSVPENVDDWRFRVRYVDSLGPCKYDAAWSDSLKYTLRGELVHRSYGGSSQCDFALIRVLNPDPKVKGYQFSGSLPDEPDSSAKILNFTHPNGLTLKYAQYQERAHWPHLLDTTNRDRYFFSYFDVSSGCSGSPIFEEDTLIGIVTAAGNVGKDFNWDCSSTTVCCRKWRFVNPAGYHGTQVLKIAAVFHELESKGLAQDLFPAGWQSNPSRAPGLSFSFANDSLYVLRDTLYRESKAGNKIEKRWALKDRVTVKLRKGTFEVFKGAIDDKLLLPLRSRLHSSSWPQEHIDKYDSLGLRFTYPVKFKNYSPLPPHQRVAALEGIGEMDIIDELPYNSPKLQQVWLADGNYVELSLDKNDDIKIRTLDGLVDIYRRQF